MDDAHRQHLLSRIPPRAAWFRTGTLVVLLGLLSAISGDARVFRRWTAAAATDRTMTAIGGTRVYAADILLNGGRGRLTLFQFRAPLRGVAAALRKAFNTDRIGRPTGSLHQCTIETDDRIVRLVLLEPPSGAGTLVFSIDQDRAQADRSATAPPRDPIAAVPAMPGAETRFHARDETARSDMALFTCTDTPAAVAAFYRTRLAARGWAEPLPARRDNSPRPRLLLFERDNALCCLYIAAQRRTGQTQLAVLHKELGIP